MNNLMQYYGADWLGMFAYFFSLYWLGDKKWYGFAVGAFSSLCWTLFGIFTGSLPATVANIVFIFLNLRGLVKWKKNRLQASLS